MYIAFEIKRNVTQTSYSMLLHNNRAKYPQGTIKQTKNYIYSLLMDL